MQVGRVVAAVLVVGTVIGGCGGPSQAGSAVIIDGDAVPLERVQSQLDVALSRTQQIADLTAQGGGPPDIARSIVSREVLHDLLTRRAATDGIAVSDSQVDEELAKSGGVDAALQSSIYDLPALRSRVRDDLIAMKLAMGSIGGLVVKADLVAVNSRAEADATAATLAAGGPAADALFGDPQNSAKDQSYDAVTAPDAAGTVLFGTPVGGIVAFQPDLRESTWIVFRVTDRRTGQPFDEQAVSAISSTQLISIGERLLQPDADRLGVRVNPRFGVWDPIQLRVVAADEQAGTIMPPPPAPAAG